MTYATTFSGIGGWELGLNACGWELKWQCEREPFCQALLKERFGVPIYDDIRTIREHNPEPVDALIGSPPCQPFSSAGLQKGTADERHLYPAFLDLVRHIKPRWILMEQVPAILTQDAGRSFGQYIGGLAAERYSLVWHCIPGCAVGAPIERDRVWILAVSHEVDGCPRVGIQQDRSKTLQSFDPRERLEVWLQTTRDFVGMGNGFPDLLYDDRVSGLGNAVIPIIPFLLGQAINQIESVNA